DAPVFNVLPVIENEPLSAPPAANVYVKVSPLFGSVEESVPTVVPEGWFSSTLFGESWMSVGATLVCWTITSVAPPQFPAVASRLRRPSESAQKNASCAIGGKTRYVPGARHAAWLDPCRIELSAW